MEVPSKPATVAARSFLRNVLVMMTGTVMAQALPMLVAPVLTRIYDPTEYGVYATFLLVSYTISALASARYEFAIMLPEDEGDAFNIASFCVATAGIVAAVVLAVVLALRVLGIDVVRLGPYLPALPVVVFLMSAYQTLTYWMLRQQRFRALSITNMGRAALTAGANVCFGVLALRGSLIVSTLLGQLIAVLLLGVQTRKDVAVNRGALRMATMLRLAKKYRQFPLFSLPADVMSYGSLQLPVAFFDTGSAGLFTFVQTVINAPLSLAAGSVLDAFKERATRDYRERGEFREVLVKVTIGLAALALAPMLVLALWGPPIFALVFGERWRAGGQFARILTIMYLFKFVASPISYSYFVVEKQKEDFWLHVYILVSTSIVLALGMRVLHDVPITLLAFSINYALFYCFYIVRSYQFSQGRR